MDLRGALSNCRLCPAPCPSPPPPPALPTKPLVFASCPKLVAPAPPSRYNPSPHPVPPPSFFPRFICCSWPPMDHCSVLFPILPFSPHFLLSFAPYLFPNPDMSPVPPLPPPPSPCPSNPLFSAPPCSSAQCTPALTAMMLDWPCLLSLSTGFPHPGLLLQPRCSQQAIPSHPNNAHHMSLCTGSSAIFSSTCCHKSGKHCQLEALYKTMGSLAARCSCLLHTLLCDSFADCFIALISCLHFIAVWPAPIQSSGRCHRQQLWAGCSSKSHLLQGITPLQGRYVCSLHTSQRASRCCCSDTACSAVCVDILLSKLSCQSALCQIDTSDSSLMTPP